MFDITVWMEVTQDKYELPVAVADTARELGKIRGVSKNCIISTISHCKKGNTKKSKYIKVEIPDEMGVED